MKALLTKQGLVLLPGWPLVLATALCAGTAKILAAQSGPLSGPVSFSFTNPTTPVYDLTGSYQFNHGVTVSGHGTVDLSLGCSLAQDAAGRLHGAGVTNIMMGSNSLAAQYTVSGTVTGGGGGATRVSFSASWVVPGSGAGAKSSTISVQYSLQVSPGSLGGTACGQVRLAGLGSGTIRGAVANVPIPANVDGSWTVNMNLQPPGGSGSILLANGRSLQANPTVSYSARSGLQSIKLSGAGADRGTTVAINFLPATSVLSSLSGKVLGQTVALKRTSAGTVTQTAPPALSPPNLSGSQACLECHNPIQQTVNGTRHAQVGVQCEDCHGPADNHAANPYDPASTPTVDYAGTLCGSCHSGPQHPIYEEWRASGHAEVITGPNAPSTSSGCNQCHSGVVRVNLVDGTPLPAVNANVPLGCPTCHNPHQATGQPVQLRNPVFSTNYYSVNATASLASSYIPNINLCGQCHNARGASWTDSSAPPHTSPQYNMLLGSVGELDSGSAQYDPGSHGLLITNQCVGCHMQSAPYQSPTQPAITGHQFEVNSYGVCAGCHGSAENASNLVVFVTAVFTNQIQAVTASLDYWATNKAPAALSAKYGTRAWEYTTPGALSPGGPGPTAAEQALIPVNIQKARFNLYLVLYNGSLGVHNPLYSLTLLDTAQSWVEQESSP